MSFLDCQFFDGITESVKIEAQLSDYYNHTAPLIGGDLPLSDSYDFHLDPLEVSETSMDLEAMIQSNIGNVADYLSQPSSYNQPQQPSVVKRESQFQHDDDEDSASCLPSTLNDAIEYPSMMLNSYETAASSPAGQSTTSSSTSTSRRFKSGNKNVNKDSDEYKRRRTLNNIAVKKSREKAKAESRMIAQRVTVLTADKERLEKRVEQLSKEIQFLHGLFSKFSDIPEPIKAQVANAFARLQSQPR